MFKSVLKSLFLFVLCIFTISCSFVSENTGSLHLKLPNSNESRAYRSIDSGVNKELSYSIVITPDKTNYNQFSFSEDNVTDKLFVECIPIGKYTITINGLDGKYKYFNEPEVFYINAGKKTSLNIKLQSELIEEVKPTPEPEKPNVNKGNLLVSFKNGPVTPIDLTVSLYKGSEKIGSDYTVKSKESLPINDLVVGNNYKVEVSGKDNNKNYDATVDSISVIADTQNPIEVSLNSSPLAKPEAPKGNLKISFIKGPSPAIDVNVKLTKGINEVYNTTHKTDTTFSIPNLELGTDYNILIEGSTDTHKYSYSKNQISITKGDNPLNVELTATEGKGSLVLSFTNAPASAVTLTVKLFKASVLKETKDVLASNSVTFTNLEYATDYKISVTGTINNKPYDFTKESIGVNSSSAVSVVVDLDNSIKPNPNSGIFVVNEFGSDDSSNDGSKPFKTISGARSKIANTLNKKGYTIYVTSDITEPTNLNGATGYSIFEDATITTENDAKYTITGSYPFVLQNSNLTLGSGITIKNTNKEAFKVGEKGQVILQNSTNIASDNYINLQLGGSIKFNKDYVGADGAIKLKMIGQAGADSEVGGAESQSIAIINSVDTTTLPIATAVKKVNLESKQYTLTSEGKVAKKTSNTVSTLAELQFAITNGKNVVVSAPITIATAETLDISNNITITRGQNVTSEILKISQNGALTIKSTNNSKLTFDGENKEVAAPFIKCEGSSLDIANCIFKNNNNTIGTGALASGAIYYGTKGTNLKITGCEFRNNNGPTGQKKHGTLTITNYSKNTQTLKATLTNNIFDSNKSYNGAIAIQGDGKQNLVDVSIEKCTITNNSAFGNGGGINCVNSTVSINNSTINNNIAGTSGGGIAIGGSSVTIATTTLSGNKKNNGNSTGSGKGNSICVVTSNNSTLNVNKKIVTVTNKNPGIDEDITETWTQK